MEKKRWKRLDILSLKDTHDNAEKLLEALFDDEVKVEEELNKFQDQIEVNKTASIVIQNPLLLGFLLQLSINGIKLVQQRTSLYKSIINLSYKPEVLNDKKKRNIFS